MTSGTKILVIFYSPRKREKNTGSVQYIEKIHDPDIRKKIILDELKSRCPDIEFIGGDVISDLADLAKEIKEHKDIDGVLFYFLNYVIRKLPWFFREKEIDISVLREYPMIVAFDPMEFGSGIPFLEFCDLIREKKLRAIPVCSFDLNDLVKRLNLIRALHDMKKSRILNIGECEELWDHSYWWRLKRDQFIKAVKEIFGVEIVTMPYEKLVEYYNKVSDEDARKLAKKWIENSIAMINIDEEEIIRDAKMYYALKAAMKEVSADTVTIDCIKALFFDKKLLPAFPCLAFAQLNNEGYTAVCEADMNAVITQLLGRHITGRAGFICDRTLDTSSNRAFYWHCTCPTKMYGIEGPSLPYIIRKTHLEEGTGLQVLAPVGQAVTVVKFNVSEKALALHQGRILGNEHHIGCKCRTEWVLETNAKRILDTHIHRLFGNHRVIFFGDLREEFLDIAKLIDFKVIEEDK